MNDIEFIEKYCCIKTTSGKVNKIHLKDYQKEFIKYINTFMSGKLDSAEDIINGIKAYKDLDSIHKIARLNNAKRKCTNCSYKGFCPNDVLIICINSYENGFVSGVKHHRKIVKERTENKISKIFKLSYKEIKEKLIKYFKDCNYGYFAEVPREDIIEFLNSK